MRQSVVSRGLCWAQLRCDTHTVHRGCVMKDSCQDDQQSLNGSCVLETPAQFGYWWNGEAQGNFGVILKSKRCNGCPGNNNCSDTSSTKTTTTLFHTGCGKGGFQEFTVLYSHYFTFRQNSIRFRRQPRANALYLISFYSSLLIDKPKAKSQSKHIGTLNFLGLRVWVRACQFYKYIELNHTKLNKPDKNSGRVFSKLALFKRSIPMPFKI